MAGKSRLDVRKRPFEIAFGFLNLNWKIYANVFDSFFESYLGEYLKREMLSREFLDWRARSSGEKSGPLKRLRDWSSKRLHERFGFAMTRGTEEQSRSSAKAIFVARSDSLPCMLRLPFVDVSTNVAHAMDTFVWDFTLGHLQRKIRFRLLATLPLLLRAATPRSMKSISSENSSRLLSSLITES